MEEIIDCILITDKGQQQVRFPTSILLDGIKALRTKGKEFVTTQNKDGKLETYEVSGIYIPAKGSKAILMIVNDNEGNY